MSDADDQMGGTGEERGGTPEKPPKSKRKDRVDEEGEESFPASDPPGSY